MERLNAAYASGNISEDAYPGLLDAVFSATTLGDVAPVVGALPGEVTYHVVLAVIVLLTLVWFLF